MKTKLILFAALCIICAGCVTKPLGNRRYISSWTTISSHGSPWMMSILLEAQLRTKKNLHAEGFRSVECVIRPQLFSYEALIISQYELTEKEMQQIQDIVQLSISEAWKAIADELSKE